jgi:hypothetical protein
MEATMSKNESIRIDLTKEQQHQTRQASHAVQAVELNVQELEQRIAPSDTIELMQWSFHNAYVSN